MSLVNVNKKKTIAFSQASHVEQYKLNNASLEGV